MPNASDLGLGDHETSSAKPEPVVAILMMGYRLWRHIRAAMATINRVIGEESRALTDPESTDLRVAELADSSVEYRLFAFW